MKILICGGRDFTNQKAAFEWLDEFKDTKAAYPGKQFITEVITGMARGADMIGRQWAIARGIKTIDCPADWETHGKSAGFKRNLYMASLNPDVVIAFPGGRGTQHMIDIATKANIKVVHPEV